MTAPECTPPKPSRAACFEQVQRVDPQAYARSRNHLGGAVTGLSPWISHGLITLREVAEVLAQEHRLDVQHKLVVELGWRAYYRHVWEDRGMGILASIHPGPLPDDAYSDRLPLEVREGRSGVPAIDQAVRTLYSTGLLHNHARMWLASYLVHLRRVHWRVGADWMIGHLLDGDLASNHLSWQWVAGTSSHKPYLFNAENVARYAPEAWRSPGTVIDRSYAELEAIARGATLPRHGPSASVGIAEAGLLFPGAADEARDFDSVESAGIAESAHPAGGAGAQSAAGAFRAQLGALRNCALWLVHPWALRPPPPHPPGRPWTLVGCLATEPMALHPWSARRMAWVTQGMREQTRIIGRVSLAELVASVDPSCTISTWTEAYLAPFLPARIQGVPEAALFRQVRTRCDSFSRWWKQTTRGLESLDELLAVQGA